MVCIDKANTNTETLLANQIYNTMILTIRAAIINTVATTNPIFREINQIPTEVEAMAGVLNKQEDAVGVGPITRIITITSISTILMISRLNSMAHPVAYEEVLITPLSIATKENTI